MPDAAEAQKERGLLPEDTFGARLALVRQRHQWNISEAAEACGINVSTWTTWEHEVSRPRNMDQVVDKIAAGSGFDRDWLMWGEAYLLSTEHERPHLELIQGEGQGDRRVLPGQGRLALFGAVE